MAMMTYGSPTVRSRTVGLDVAIAVCTRASASGIATSMVLVNCHAARRCYKSSDAGQQSDQATSACGEKIEHPSDFVSVRLNLVDERWRQPYRSGMAGDYLCFQFMQIRFGPGKEGPRYLQNPETTLA